MNYRRILPASLLALALVFATSASANAVTEDFSNSQCTARATMTSSYAKTARVSGTCNVLSVTDYLATNTGGVTYWTATKKSVSGASSVTRNADTSTGVIASAHSARNGTLGQALPA